ncbi:SOS response-associated peptidase [Jiella sp. MQZ9-1]|uniref:Abasic site processing protein n=1 Tax=Jiella flava TaxID=2816857 RepID=A0A939FZC3_9HYPH|nr:SOS response-associated peptidase [Jiella flava]MBO0664365.1 SOS response-associated peptidase [Jiella flava]MCD2473001.1 SOS response-associated peptidase [Jiella flava]
MAGRFALTASPETVKAHFALSDLDPFPPRPAILPTHPILVVLAGREGRFEVARAGRLAQLVRWGLIPNWFKAEGPLPALFNAKAETAHENAAFRGPLRHRRCLVPASAFFRKLGGKGGPTHRVSLDGEAVIALAGVMESYMAPDGSEVDTAAILTAETWPVDRGRLSRLPVVIAPHDYPRWLDCRSHEPAAIAGLMRALPLTAFTLTAA